MTLRTLMGSAAALLLCLAPASTTRASPQDLFGYGGRTPGLAMTGTSYAEGYEAVFANVAGLAPVRHRGLHVGFHGAGYGVAVDGERRALEPPRGMSIGFHLPLPFGDVLEDRLVLGGAFFTPASALLEGRVYFPEAVQFPVLDRAQVIAIQMGLGIDLRGLVDGLHVGVGVSALADVVGELAVRLDETNAFSSVVETQLLTTFAPLIGVRYVQPQFGLGLAYRHELAARMDLRIATEDLPIELPLLTVGGVVQYDPPTLLAEGHWRPFPDSMIVLNLTTRLWSAYPGAPLPTTAMGTNAPAPGFSIRPSPRIAFEQRWRDANFTIAFRAGYAFEPTPAPVAAYRPRRTADGTPIDGAIVPYRAIDNHRHVLTLGGGWTVNFTEREDGEKLVIDVYGQLHVLQPREHGIGRTDDGAPMVSDGFILAGGWTTGLEF